MFAYFIIRTFQLVFSAGTIFFSHNKSAGTVFRLVFSAKRTGPKNLSKQKLNEVRLIGSHDTALKDDIEKQLEEHPRNPPLKLEELEGCWAHSDQCVVLGIYRTLFTYFSLFSLPIDPVLQYILHASGN